MAWVTCPHCGFTQIPSARCQKCHKSLDRTTGDVARPAAAPGAAAGEAPGYGQVLKSLPRAFLWTIAALALAVVAAILIWSRGSAISAEGAGLPPPATPEPWS